MSVSRDEINTALDNFEDAAHDAGVAESEDLIVNMQAVAETSAAQINALTTSLKACDLTVAEKDAQIAALEAEAATANGMIARDIEAALRPRGDIRDWADPQKAADSGDAIVVESEYNFLLDHPILLSDDFDWLVHGNIVKTNTAGDGVVAGIFRNRNFDVPLQGGRFWGTGTIGARDWKATGSILCLRGNDLVLDVTIPCFSDSRAIVLAGDDIVMRRPKVYGSPREINNGGLRFVGGKRFRAYDSYIVSGDDAMQFVPSGSDKDPFFDLDITDCWYIGGFAQSWHAKAMVWGLQRRVDGKMVPSGMSNSILRSGFKGVRGFGGKWALAGQNLSSSGSIADCAAVNCNIDMGKVLRDPPLAADVQFNATPGGGGIKRISGDIVVKNPAAKAIYDTNGPCTEMTLKVTPG